VIASEGTRTEPTYFEAVRDYLLASPSRVHVEVLRRTPGSPSAPEYVIEQLDSFKKNWRLSSSDELWAVIDYDSWGETKLSEVATAATQKGYQLAVSRPCFEVWRLLHFEDLNQLPQCDREFLDQGKCATITDRVRQACGACGKNLGDIQEYLPLTELAVSRSTLLVNDTHSRWPISLGTFVHLLVKSIQGV
jgi:hypothetical protein